MKFLEKYHTLDAFKNENKGFEGLTIPKSLGDMLYVGGLEGMLDHCKVNVGAGQAKETYTKLRTIYSDQEILYGLMTLGGIGKGANAILEHRGTYVAKFSAQERDEYIQQNPGFFDKMNRAVELARRLVRKTEEAFDAPEHATLDAAVRQHFLLDRDDPLWATVRQNYRNIRQFLHGMFRLAATTHKDSRASTVGYVRYRRIEDGDPVSPYKTAGVPASERTSGGPTHAGSVHVDYRVFHQPLWTDLGVAAVIVHEASHKVCSTEDHAYVSDGEKYADLSPELRVDNADCYGYAAASVYAGKVLTTEDTSRLSES